MNQFYYGLHLIPLDVIVDPELQHPIEFELAPEPYPENPAE